MSFNHSTFFIFLVAIFCVTQSSCFLDKDGCTDPDATNFDPDADNDDNTCEYEDPDGTQFIVLGKDCSLLNAIDFSFGSAECDTCIGPPNDRGTDILYNGTNFVVSGDTSCFGQASLGIVSMGQICCLGEIKSAPSDGYDNLASGALSFGYVVRCREGDFARFYVDRLVIDQFGQPEAAEIYFQYPIQ